MSLERANFTSWENLMSFPHFGEFTLLSISNSKRVLILFFRFILFQEIWSLHEFFSSNQLLRVWGIELLGVIFIVKIKHLQCFVCFPMPTICGPESKTLKVSVYRLYMNLVLLHGTSHSMYSLSGNIIFWSWSCLAYCIVLFILEETILSSFLLLHH